MIARLHKGKGVMSMNRKKIVKIILLFLLILLIIFFIYVLRNFLIIKHIQKDIEPYILSTNYHMKTMTKENSGVTITIDYYKKDDKQAMIMERNNNEEITKMSYYDNGERTDMFVENTKNKIAKLNTNSTLMTGITDYMQTENIWQTFLSSISAKIRNINYNGTKCYEINKFMSPMFLDFTDKNTIYIEKDTGLCLKVIGNNSVTERQYEMNSVNDDIFVEPDIGQYEIQ